MVSIIIPAHNEENYIGRTLEALGDKHEIIIVCNGCIDKTFDIASKYNCKIFNLDAKGVSLARNFGAGHATHNKLVFLDADIIVDNDTLDKIENSNYDVGVTKVKADSDRIWPRIVMGIKSNVHRFGCSTGIMFLTKERFEAAGKFDESIELGEDGKLLRAAKNLGNYGVVDTFVYNSMRRFEKTGYTKTIWFWIKHNFLKQNKYEVIR